jgi:hypothetical protein
MGSLENYQNTPRVEDVIAINPEIDHPGEITKIDKESLTTMYLTHVDRFVDYNGNLTPLPTHELHPWLRFPNFSLIGTPDTLSTISDITYCYSKVFNEHILTFKASNIKDSQEPLMFSFPLGKVGIISRMSICQKDGFYMGNNEFKAFNISTNGNLDSSMPIVKPQQSVGFIGFLGLSIMIAEVRKFVRPNLVKASGINIFLPEQCDRLNPTPLGYDFIKDLPDLEQYFRGRYHPDEAAVKLFREITGINPGY